MSETKRLILNSIEIGPFLRALKQFNAANIDNDKKSDLEKAGLIQFFELTYELAWKTMKRVLEFRGINEKLNSPRDVFRHAAANSLIDEAEPWFEFLKDRNLTVHTYNEETCDLIIDDMDSFGIEINKFAEVLKNLK